jgi:DNA-binding MarR family transcriptional regulator
MAMNNKEKFGVTDNSGDRKYFTQIPNMIVNHSTAYEQSLYLIMKRLAGEGGQCYASLNFLSQKMGVHKTTVTRTIEKLLKMDNGDRTHKSGGWENKNVCHY